MAAMLNLIKKMAAQPPAINISAFSKHSHVAGRVIVITGGNAGLGYAAAEHFAKLRPARVIVSSRSMERGNKAVEGIRPSFHVCLDYTQSLRSEAFHWVRRY